MKVNTVEMYVRKNIAWRAGDNPMGFGPGVEKDVCQTCDKSVRGEVSEKWLRRRVWLLTTARIGRTFTIALA